MKRVFKSYLAFMTGLYSILFLLLAPLVIVLAGTLFGGVFVGTALFLFVEIGGDFWLFGGICSRHSEKLAYVMSSVRGTEVFKNALAVSMIRMFFYFFIELSGIGILSSCIFGESRLWHMFSLDIGGVRAMEDKLVFFAAFLFAGYALCLIGMMAARFFTSIRAMTYVCYFVFVVLIFSYALIWLKPYLALAFYTPLAVISSVLSLWLVERRMKGDYYDTAVKTRS